MANVKIGRMVLGVCQTNCYFVYREGEQKAVVVDPADYGDHIYETLQKNGFEVAGILLTHGHFDHIWGCEKLKGACAEAGNPVEIYAGAEEEKLLQDTHMNVSEQAGRACSLQADKLLADGEEVKLAGITFRVIFTPGHTGGSVCYYIEEAGLLLSGDTLFAESVGRTDFPTGSMSTLARSIKEKLFTLPEDTLCYPGHGDSTTIGHEKDYNPYCG